MSLLPDRSWRPYYDPDVADLLHDFYIPALACAVRYDRSTGYFTAPALAFAMRGLEGLILNSGRMRLLVGCTLDEAEVDAIEKGENLRDTVEAQLLRVPLVPPDEPAREALELLAWMVAKGILDVKVAVPCDNARRPVANVGLFHAKAGIIEDKEGNRLAFNGSINETEAGWRHNFETFHVYTIWEGGTNHVDAEERAFQELWAGRSKRALVIDVPTAKREELLTFLPADDTPARLKRVGEDVVDDAAPQPEPKSEEPIPPRHDPRKVIWSFIRHAPTLPDGGERVGEATAAIIPWPHQMLAFERLYRNWPPRLLIADEVGLGKTIEAGLLLRQALLAGKARRILVMAPKAVLPQWQIELREKFNLNWPIYDGRRLSWCSSPALGDSPFKSVGRGDWHREHCVIVSSQLMRRSDRVRELLEDAEPWDLIVLDEAHHARRRAGGLGSEERPNQLLRLMRQLKERAQGLVLLTATPMQVSPIEVWDLLALLGMPEDWTTDRFLDFFETVGKDNPSHEEMARLARLFRSVESAYGETDLDEVKRTTAIDSSMRVRRILRALRDEGTIPLRQLETEDRKAALRVLRAGTPVRRLISRHTRRLLRRYYEAGRISTPLARRKVNDRFVNLSPDEAGVYGAVEDYISTTYNRAAKEKRTAIGFVMTIYRRRLASSFHALTQTLERRLQALRSGHSTLFETARLEEDVEDDEARDDTMDAEEAEALEREALAIEERDDIEELLRMSKRLPADTKASELLDTVQALRNDGYKQVMVFTQYTDTMDFLRDFLVKESALSVMCFSGRGGEVLTPDRRWTVISRDRAKELFREGAANVLLCTEAAAEGLNFQFCGALVNYDMPWNPMRVEQRIGRIDRLGQEHPIIRIVNLHYRGTVETDVYMVLRERIHLFEEFVGRLQPILARLPGAIRSVALAGADERERDAAELVDSLSREAEEVEAHGFDIDEITEVSVEEVARPAPAYELADLQRILTNPALLPPGDEVKPVGNKDFQLSQPGMARPIRVTTDTDYYEQHADSVELWSPGCPVFPHVDDMETVDGVTAEDFRRALES